MRKKTLFNRFGLAIHHCTEGQCLLLEYQSRDRRLKPALVQDNDSMRRLTFSTIHGPFWALLNASLTTIGFKRGTHVPK